MNKRKSYGLNIGASSILIVIVVLCLVCFAGLSIASANADYRLSKKLADRTSDYYTACNEAQEILMQLSHQLSDVYEDSSSASDYEQKIKESMADSLTFRCSINENQSLEVSILPVYPNTVTNGFYKITSWKIITLSLPELDASLPVLLGD